MAVSISMDGRVALITGGGRGIGKAAALAFAGAGADVVVCARTKPEIEATCAEVRALGRRALAVECDVADEAQAKNVIAKGIDAFGRIDVLVNNAGGASGSVPLVDCDMADWDRVIATNLRGTALFTKYVLPSMMARKSGNIINISSTWGRTAGRGKPAYVAAKWAVIGLTQAVALEVAADGVRVNCVVPGYTMTEAIQKNREEYAAKQGISYEQSLAEAAAFSPLNRIQTPEEVADVIVWLASDKAMSIHGQTINANAALFMN